MERGTVFNIQKYSLQDGPGIRTTVFLKGCPLSCAWCHNPEGISSARELLVVETRCAGCGECRAACPFGASLGGDGALPARNEPCTLCSECVEACPTGARQMAGRQMTVAQVMKVIRQDRLFYEDSKGGATFSGGEPLTQPAFLRQLLEACQASHIHTAVDTCGFACTDHLLAIAPLTGLFLYDLKLMDEARHRQFCGVSNQPIIENLKALARVHSNIWVRLPVIPGVNDDDDNFHAVARFIRGLGGVRQVNLLPYHKTGAQKSRRLGHPERMADAPSLSAGRLEKVAAWFRTHGLDARVGG